MSGKLEDLIVRVMAATGPDRELDGEILVACGCRFRQRGTFEVIEWPTGDRIKGDCIPITASLDAALALVERVLPRWEFNLSVEYPDDQCGDAFWRMSLGDPLMGFDAEAPTPAIAILAALLCALQYRTETP